MTFQSILKMVLIAAAILIVLAVVTFCILFYDMVYAMLIPPLSPIKQVPIDITKAGSTASILIRIRYHRSYDFFGYRLVFNMPEDLEKNSLAYRERRDQLAEFVGQYASGVKIPVKIMVNRVKDGRQIPFHEQVYYTEGCYSWGHRRFTRRIKSFYMNPGYYQVRLENLTAITSLPEGVTVALEVLPSGRK